MDKLLEDFSNETLVNPNSVQLQNANSSDMLIDATLLVEQVLQHTRGDNDKISQALAQQQLQINQLVASLHGFTKKFESVADHNYVSSVDNGVLPATFAAPVDNGVLPAATVSNAAVPNAEQPSMGNHGTFQPPTPTPT